MSEAVHKLTWISMRCAFFWPILILLICVCARTRMTVQCFFIAFKDSSMLFWPSPHFFAYFVKDFFFAFDLQRHAKARMCTEAEVWQTPAAHPLVKIAILRRVRQVHKQLITCTARDYQCLAKLLLAGEQAMTAASRK